MREERCALRQREARDAVACRAQRVAERAPVAFDGAADVLQRASGRLLPRASFVGPPAAAAGARCRQPARHQTARSEWESVHVR